MTEMVDTREQIKQRLFVLVGLDFSGVGHAADMLTLQFGPIREITTKRQTIKRVGAWSVQTIEVGDNGMVRIGLSRDVRISITTDGISDEEDWRFFASGSDAKHFVITGGKVDPWSLS